MQWPSDQLGTLCLVQNGKIHLVIISIHSCLFNQVGSVKVSQNYILFVVANNNDDDDDFQNNS